MPRTKDSRWFASMLCFVLCGTGISCRDSAPSRIAPEGAPEAAWLVDQAVARGVRFVHQSGAESGDRALWALPEIMSGGVALFDLEGDGDLDLYFVQSGDLVETRNRPANRLFENTGEGRFRDITPGSGAEDRSWGMGVATGDIDNDGLVDLYITNLGPNVLLRNLGNGTFEDVTDTAGVGDPGFSSSAALVDYDLDGDLDLFSLNYFHWSLETERPCFDAQGRRDYCRLDVYQAPAANRLFRNRGDGRFDDVSLEAGIAGALATSLGVVTGDFTGDGWPDLFVANDGMPDRLWVGASNGRFENQAPERACAVDISGKAKAGMGTDAADLDNDGDLDLIVGNLRGETDSLFINAGNEFFVEATAKYGLAASSRRVTRFGLGFVDFDNDGRLDLMEVAGAVFGGDPVLGFGERNALLRQTPGGGFVEVEGAIAGSGASQTSRGAAFGDINGDGWIDAVVINRDAPAELLINQQSGSGHSLQVLALDRWGKPALGASIEAEIGGVILRRDCRSAFGYLAAHDPRVHFAFTLDQRPRSIRVRWPGGDVESFSTGISNVLEVKQGAGMAQKQISRAR